MITHVPPDVCVPDDYVIEQGSYTADEHALWRTLYDRQWKLLPNRVVNAFRDGVGKLKIANAGIPEFKRLNETLHTATGWQVVAVPGLVPDDVFYTHMANRRFPAGNFMRRRDQLDYIQEPDVFHDVFGHVPLLMNPTFADYIHAYAELALETDPADIFRLARLYWFTVEFGLIATQEGPRIYGAGIVSSAGESVFSLESPSPHRIAFDLRRVLRTDYRIDDYQPAYFVIDGAEQLYDLVRGDLPAALADVRGLPDLAPGQTDPGDHFIHRGTGEYHAKIA